MIFLSRVKAIPRISLVNIYGYNLKIIKRNYHMIGTMATKARLQGLAYMKLLNLRFNIFKHAILLLK